MGYNIWVLTKAYGFVVKFEPCQSVQKGKQVASSTTWGLRENEYVNNHFTSFCQLTHLGVNNICATIKICYVNALCTMQKKNVIILNSAHKTQKVEQF